jgi:para-nitrobenzyl esterase
MLRAVVVACIIAAVAVQAQEGVNPPNPTPAINTTNGPVLGYVDAGVQIFRGVPFGAPPTETFRFKAPRPPTPWLKPMECYVQKHVCPQFRILDFVFMGNEDCLFLDVYVPPHAPTDTRLRPVMFWIYGGGYSFGDNWEFGLYDGKNLAKKRDVVIVAANYRLGPLGFLALNQLKTEDKDGSTGNFALQDQLLALQWTRDNIKNFGGDPNQITIFGESAGAFSVCWHLVNPISRGIFKSAIMESGSCDSDEFFRSYNDAVSWSETFAATVGCDKNKTHDLVGCLRRLPTGHVMGHLFGPRPKGAKFIPKLFPLMPWGPAIDGSKMGLSDKPLNLIKAGNWAKVPVMLGTNQDEGTIFVIAAPIIVPGVTFPMTPRGLDLTLHYFFENSSKVIDEIDNYYPASAYKSTDLKAAAILRDYFFVCSARRVMKFTTASGVANSRLYHFTYKGDWIEDPFIGDYHSAELEFVFDNEWPPIVHIFSERDKFMADAFGTYWTNFAYFQNPNGNATTKFAVWPQWDGAQKQNVAMDVPPRIESDLSGKVCDWWDVAYPSR